MLPQPSSPAINNGTAVAGITADQRGTARPVGVAPDIGAVESADANLVATGGAPADVTDPAAPAVYEFTVTYQSTGTINTATFDGNDVTVTPPAGVTAPTVSVFGFSAPSPQLVVAYYQFTAPGGAWTFADNGVYTLTAKAGQVADLNGVTAPADRVIGSFEARLPIVVTNTNDDTNPGSLRWALGLANAVYGTADTIVFNTNPVNGTDFSQPQAITLTSGTPLAATDSVAVVGPGAGLLTISGNHATRVFNLNGNGVLNDSLSGLTITAGKSVSGAGGAIGLDNEIVTLTDCRVTGNVSTGAGGAIGVGDYGNLVLRNCTVAGNSAATQGGGVTFAGGGTLSVDHSTLSGNTAGGGTGGGGVYFVGTAGSFAGTAGLTPNGLTVTDSTISGNSAVTDGGGVEVYQSYGTVTVQNSTIAFNSAGGNGGGLSAAGTGTGGAATFALTSSIVARNAAGGAGPDVNDVVAGGVSGPVVADHSLIGVADFGFVLVDNGGNRTGTSATPLDPLLGPLTNNGGPTQTHALTAGSPAIDAGANPTNLTTDQRGLLRTFGSAPDMGAFEKQAPTVASVAVNDGSAQRSEVRKIVVTFDSGVSFSGNATPRRVPAVARQFQRDADQRADERPAGGRDDQRQRPDGGDADVRHDREPGPRRSTR